MKKLLTSLLVLFSLGGWAQLEIKSEKETPKTVEIGEFRHDKRFGKLAYFHINGDTLIHLMFQNEKYSSITDTKSVSLKGGLKELNTLYEAVLKIATGNQGDKLDLTMGKSNVSISKEKNYCIFWAPEGYFTFNEKDWRYLFNRK